MLLWIDRAVVVLTVARVSSTFTHFVVSNVCLSERLARLAQKVIAQNDGDFMDVILLYLSNCEYF
jgi:hypothetical protein